MIFNICSLSLCAIQRISKYGIHHCWCGTVTNCECLLNNLLLLNHQLFVAESERRSELRTVDPSSVKLAIHRFFRMSNFIGYFVRKNGRHSEFGMHEQTTLVELLTVH